MKNSFKVVLLGSRGCGKSSLLDKLVFGDFRKDYDHITHQRNVTVKLNTNIGVLTFECADTTGRFPFSEDHVDEYGDTDGVIVMFDLADSMSYTFSCIRDWQFEHINKNSLPRVACGNKLDKEKEIDLPFIKQKIRFKACVYTSVLNDVNIHTPFITLAREMTGNNDINYLWSK